MSIISARDVQMLEIEGWEVECESPLEIREKCTNAFATGIAAAIVIDYLKKRRREKRKKKCA